MQICYLIITTLVLSLSPCTRRQRFCMIIGMSYLSRRLPLPSRAYIVKWFLCCMTPQPYSFPQLVKMLANSGGHVSSLSSELILLMLTARGLATLRSNFFSHRQSTRRAYWCELRSSQEYYKNYYFDTLHDSLMQKGW
jgi:hypothetical protein